MGSVVRVVVATGGSTVGNYSRIVFTGWDYGCLGDQATILKQKNIHYQLQVSRDLNYLTGDKGKEKKSILLCIIIPFNAISWPLTTSLLCPSARWIWRRRG